MAEDNRERADRILDAASKLIVHYGYDKTTMSDIAREAGVSKGAIYLHWSSKDELFEKLIFREGERLVDDMLARIEADPEAGSVFSLYQHGILASIANPLMHSVMTQDAKVLGDFARRWVRANSASEGQLFRTEMVRQLQGAGVIRADLDADVISYVMALVRYGFLTIHQIVPDEEAPPLDEVGKMLALLFERGLAPPGGSDREAGKRVLEHTLYMLRDLVRKYREGK